MSSLGRTGCFENTQFNKTYNTPYAKEPERCKPNCIIANAQI